MTNVLMLLLVLMQAAPAANPATVLAGRWVSSAVPPPGEAPMGPPSFVLERPRGSFYYAETFKRVK